MALNLTQKGTAMKQPFNKILHQAGNSMRALLAAVLIASALPAGVFAWGPERNTYTTEKPADRVTFNSITNNPAHGDERNFLRVKEAGANNATYSDEVSLNAGKEYTVYLYYHNNAAAQLNASGVGVAKDAFARAEMPAIVKNGTTPTKGMGYVGASNATPQQVYDDISFKNTTGGDIALRYVGGSTTIHNFGTTNGATMPDTILTGNGVKLGYNALDGTLNGCNEFAGYITFRVKADQPNFDFSKQVRKSGTSAWQESAAVKAGDRVEYLLSYKNTGTTEQKDVVLKDVLPKGLTYVSGTAKLANASSPNGRTIGDGIGAGGVNIGNYAPGANAFLTFTAQVAKSSDLACGTSRLTNTAASETNNGNKQDTAEVVITQTCAPNECKPGIPTGDARCQDKCIPTGNQTVDKDGNCVTGTTSLPKTGPAQTVVVFLLLALVGAAAHYFVKRRNDHLTKLAAAVTYDNPAVLEDFIAQNHISQEEASIARSEFKHIHPGSAHDGSHHVTGHAPGHVIKPPKQQ